MSSKRDIVDIIRAVAAGSEVLWSDLDQPADETTRAILQELQIVSRVAQTHGTVPLDASNADDPPSDAPYVEHTWGPLTLLERVGAGAYGEVYRAWDTRLDREVALKLLSPDANDSPGDGAVIEEGRLLARIRHPNVVTVYGADRLDGRIGIWTEFIEGQTLAQALEEHGPYPSDEACRIAIEVCQGLAAVHRAGLVHGDIKSANVMRQDDGRVILMDFGASHHTNASRRPRLAGTPTYMAPEVINGEGHTTRSDVYSVGVLLYHLLTKTYPVIGRTLGDLRSAHQGKKERSPGGADAYVPRRILAVVNRALSPHPADRYASAEAMATAIADATRTPRVSLRRWAAVATLVVAVAIAAGLTLWFRSAGAPTAQSRLNFAPRDYVLITRFENRTGEPVFDGAVEYALQRELTASNVVGLVPEERIGDALVLMKQPRNTVIGRAVGREVAVRDGHIKALLTGRVERFGSSYVLTAQLIDPANDAVVATIGETADSQNAVLPALQRQASRVRSQLGEKWSDIRGADPNIEPAATSSLQAFQLFNQSYQLGREGQWPAAQEIIRQVVQIDPQFASGWTWLAWAVNNTGGSRDSKKHAESVEYASRAVQLSERVPEWERHWIQGSYYSLNRQPEASIPHYEALLKLRPDHFYALGNVTDAVAQLHRPRDYRKFLALLQMMGQQRPNDPAALGNAALGAVRASGAPDSARPFLEQLARLSRTGGPLAALAKFQHDFTSAHISLWIEDLAGTLAQVNAIAGRLNEYPPDQRLSAFMGIRMFYKALGRNGDAHRFASLLMEGPDAAAAKRAVAADDGDLVTLRRLVGPANQPLNGFVNGPDYVRIGMLDEARQYIKGRSPNFNPALAAVTVGQLALVDGNLRDAVAHLERGLQLTSIYNHPAYWWGCEALADALVKLQRRSDAIDRLTECSTNDFKTIGVWSPLNELRIQNDVHLSRLYRLTGNLGKAIEIEARIRKRLALADPDHPILKQLQSQ